MLEVVHFSTPLGKHQTASVFLSCKAPQFLHQEYPVPMSVFLSISITLLVCSHRAASSALRVPCQ